MQKEMHEFTPEVEELAKEILDYSLIRLRTDPPLDGPKTAQELYELAGNTITAKGLGGHEALKLFYAVLPLHTFVQCYRDWETDRKSVV